MPTIVRIDEEDRHGTHNIHEVEIDSNEEESPHDDPNETLGSQPPQVSVPTLPDPIPQAVVENPDISFPPQPPPIPPRLTQPPPPVVEMVSAGVGNDVAFEMAQDLILVDSSVLFDYEEPNSTKNIVGYFRIQNITRNHEMVIFKTKTTSQSKYFVRPTIGVINDGGIAIVRIKVLEGESLSGLINDKFLVQAILLPPEYRARFSSSESESGDDRILRVRKNEGLPRPNFQELSGLWKDLAGIRGVYIESHRLTCRINESRLAVPPPASRPEPQTMVQPPRPLPIIQTNTTTTNTNIENTEVIRHIHRVEEMVENSTYEITNGIDWIKFLLYGLMGLIVVATFMIWRMNLSSKTKPPLPIIEPPPLPIIPPCDGDKGIKKRTYIEQCFGL